MQIVFFAPSELTALLSQLNLIIILGFYGDFPPSLPHHLAPSANLVSIVVCRTGRTTLTPIVPLTYVSIVVLRTGRPQPIVPLTYVSIVELQTGWITSTPIVPLTYVSIVELRTGIF